MSVMSEEDLSLAVSAAKLAFCNPFLEERAEHERELLGSDHGDTGSFWNLRVDAERANPNWDAIGERVEDLANRCRERLLAGDRATRTELEVYRDLVLYLQYHACQHELQQTVDRLVSEPAGPGPVAVPRRLYQGIVGRLARYLEQPGLAVPAHYDPAHILALCFQVRRAFYHIFYYLLGASRPVAQLRAAVWNSIFSHDLKRYQRSLYARMGDITTLITGGTGTGKELVARAIARSRYIPYDPKRSEFTENFASSFVAVNVAALSPTLAESELFGHRRGAFTGALDDHAGYLESCSPLGTVFLDEIGELDLGIQVKLLRVLQTRSFNRLGDPQPRHFPGKLMAATNRDLAAEMSMGRFREDLYYRLCADQICTPGLRAQLAETPDELANLVAFIARREAGEDEGPALAEEVTAWISGNLAPDYAWPGNVRELEQCVRNIMVHGEYRPALRPAQPPHDELAEAMANGELSAEEVLNRYCTLVFAKTHNYVATANRLGLDRRTVKRRVDEDLLRELEGRTDL